MAVRKTPKTVSERLRDGKAIDAAVRRAVRAAVKRSSPGTPSGRRGTRAA